MDEPSFLELASAGETRLQTDDIDGAIEALEDALALGTTDYRHRAVVHCHLGNCYFNKGNLPLAAKHHEGDLYCAKQCKDQGGVIKAYSNLGQTFKAMGEFDKAIECFDKQWQLAKLTKNRQATCKALGNLAGGHSSLGYDFRKSEDHPSARARFSEAAEYLKQQLKLAEAMKDDVIIGKVAGNLGNMYEQLDDYERAVGCHKRRLKCATAANDRAAMGRAYCNLGNAYQALGDLPQAISCYEKDLEIATELGDVIGQGITCSNLGNAHQGLGHIQDTKCYHQRHLDIVTDLGHKEGMVWACANLGRVHEAVGEFDTALTYFEKQSAMGRELNNPRLERSANKHIARTKRHIDEGITVDHESAVIALMNALEQSDNKVPIAKQTIRGSIGRLFGRRLKAKRPQIVHSNESLNSMSDLSISSLPGGTSDLQTPDGFADEMTSTIATTSFSAVPPSPSLSTKSDPGASSSSRKKGFGSVRNRLFRAFQSDSLSVPIETHKRSVTPVSESEDEGKGESPAPSDAGQDEEDELFKTPLSCHASKGAALLEALESMGNSWRSQTAQPATMPSKNESTILRM